MEDSIAHLLTLLPPVQHALMPDTAMLHTSATPVDNGEGGRTPSAGTPGLTFPCRLTANRRMDQEALIDGQIQGRPTYWLSYPLVDPLADLPIELGAGGVVTVNGLDYQIAAVFDPAGLSSARTAFLWRTQTQ